MTRPVERRLRLMLVAAAVTVAAGAGVWYQLDRRLPRRFAAVVDGRLYRSGVVSPVQLERLVREYHIRTVISLLDARAPQTVAERQTARRLGIRWYNVPLPGDGASTPAQRARLKTYLFDPSLAPTLVHCAAGANRTGLAVGLFRIHQQGWELERVLQEMRQFGFKDLPHHENLREALAAEAAAARRAGDETRRPPQDDPGG